MTKVYEVAGKDVNYEARLAEVTETTEGYTIEVFGLLSGSNCRFDSLSKDTYSVEEYNKNFAPVFNSLKPVKEY
jgi:hypothetical protein